MKYKNSVKQFFKDAGKDKLFMTLCPGLCALVAGDLVFKYDITAGFLVIVAALFMQLGAKLLDDFIDWSLGKTIMRAELEQTGVRGLFNKGAYFFDKSKSPRFYFNTALIFIIISLGIILYTCFYINNFMLIFSPILVLLLAIINYLPKAEKIRQHLGSEIIIATLCAPVNMLSVFYASTKCINCMIIILSILFFFFIFNITFISSMLNIKEDKITDKMTLPILIKNDKYKLILSLIVTLYPFLLTFCAIKLSVLPKLSYFVFILLPHALWQFYLMYVFNKEPQKNIKWNMLMGEDKYKTINEQNNLNWFSVRYNFERNIFITYTIILSISIIDFGNLAIF